MIEQYLLFFGFAFFLGFACYWRGYGAAKAESAARVRELLDDLDDAVALNARLLAERHPVGGLRLVRNDGA